MCAVWTRREEHEKKGAAACGGEGRRAPEELFLSRPNDHPKRTNKSYTRSNTAARTGKDTPPSGREKGRGKREKGPLCPPRLFPASALQRTPKKESEDTKKNDYHPFVYCAPTLGFCRVHMKPMSVPFY